MADTTPIKGILKAISAAYPSFELTEDRVSVYGKLLADIPATALAAAIQQHIATSKYPPTIAELREAASVVTCAQLPTVADAWDEVMTAIKTRGSWHEPVFSHDLITKTVAGMGGWQVMCTMPVDETATWRAQFRDMFNAYASRAEADARLLPNVRALRDANLAALPAPVEDRKLIAAPTSERQSANGFSAAGDVLRFAPPMPSKQALSVYANRKEYLERMERAADDSSPEAEAEWVKANNVRQAVKSIVERDAQGAAKREVSNG